MTTPITKSSGSITTTGIQIVTGTGVMTFARASTDAGLRIYDGTSSTGTLLDHVPVQLTYFGATPVQYKTGLYAVPESTVGSSVGGSGGAIIHYT